MGHGFPQFLVLPGRSKAKVRERMMEAMKMGKEKEKAKATWIF